MDKQWIPILLASLLSACGQPEIPWQQQPDTGRWYSRPQVESGRALFKQYCAACHGLHAEGTPQWQKPLADGSYPPPPMNGSAHAWHHPYPMLVQTISDGRGKMPAWGEQLDRAQIDAVIAYFQSFWPAQGYQLWLQRHQR